MRYSFPYAWAGTLDTDALGHCCVYELPPVPQAAEPDLKRVLDVPEGTGALAELVSGAKKVLILVDDLTRNTPQHMLLPRVVDYLEDAGLDPGDITVLIATGMHRAMTDGEILTRYGRGTAERVRIINHIGSDKGSMKAFGHSLDGTPIKLNGLVGEHDCVLAIGQINPHRVAGFSGGAKMVMPGICGEEITSALHWQGWLCEGEAIYGVVENPVRLEMEAIAERAGLRFVINVVLDANESIHEIHAGDFRAAFRSGARTSERLFSLSVDSADIVVVDSHPYDLDFWQACKAISVAELVLRRGGTIILVTPCPEQFSQHSSFIEEVGYLPISEIVRRVEAGQLPDLLTACHMMAIGRILERGELIVVSNGLTPNVLAGAGLRGELCVSDAIQVARQRLGGDASIAVLRDGCKMIPKATSI